MTLNDYEGDYEGDYDVLYDDIRKMALESHVELCVNDDKTIEEMIRNSTIPNSLREYQKQTECDIEELADICYEAVKDEPRIGKIQVGYLPSDEWDFYITYSADETILLNNIECSWLVDWINDSIRDNIDDIDRIDKELKGIQNVYTCEKADKILDMYKSLLKKYYLYELEEDREKLEEYKNLLKNFYLHKMEKHINTIKRDGLEKYFMKLKLLFQEKVLEFFMDIANDIVEYFDIMGNEIIIYLDERNFEKSELPISLDMFKFTFCQTSQDAFTTNTLQEIIEWAIKNKRIQNFIEITEDKEKITYKIKIFQ